MLCAKQNKNGIVRKIEHKNGTFCLALRTGDQIISKLKIFVNYIKKYDAGSLKIWYVKKRNSNAKNLCSKI